MNDPENSRSTFGRRLAISRKRAGLAPIELAVALGDRYSEATIAVGLDAKLPGPCHMTAMRNTRCYPEGKEGAWRRT